MHPHHFNNQISQFPEPPELYPELSLPEVRELITSIDEFLASPIYQHFLKVFRTAQDNTTLLLTTQKPADLSQFLIREQGFGQLAELTKIQNWFTDVRAEFAAAAAFKEQKTKQLNSK